MAQQKPPFRRRHYFVKKDFQRGFIIKFCLVVLAGVVISTGLLLLFSKGTLTSSFQHSRLVIRNTAWAVLPSAALTNLITLGLISLASVFVTLFISHKLAGPLFRYELELRKVADGDLTREIILRKNDQITDIGTELTKMTASMREKVTDIRTDVDQLLQIALKQEAPRDLSEGLNDLRQKIDSSFKL